MYIWFVPGSALVSAMVAGSNPAEDDEGYDLFGEIALKHRRFFIVCI